MPSHVATDDEVSAGLTGVPSSRELLRFLRARLNPEDIGLPSYERRRVPGLRREEPAQPAGVSYAYYADLERGYGETMSAEVMDAAAPRWRPSSGRNSLIARQASCWRFLFECVRVRANERSRAQPRPPRRTPPERALELG
jgi:hypothetical protein